MRVFENIREKVKFYIAGVMRWFSPPKIKSYENWNEYKICWFGAVYCAEWMIKKIGFALVLPLVVPVVLVFMEIMTVYEIVSTPVKAPFTIYETVKRFKRERAEKTGA